MEQTDSRAAALRWMVPVKLRSSRNLWLPVVLWAALATMFLVGPLVSRARAQASLAAEDIAQDVKVKIDGVEETFTVVRDALQRNQWYYMPNSPRLYAALVPGPPRARVLPDPLPVPRPRRPRQATRGRHPPVRRHTGNNAGGAGPAQEGGRRQVHRHQARGGPPLRYAAEVGQGQPALAPEGDSVIFAAAGLWHRAGYRQPLEDDLPAGADQQRDRHLREANAGQHGRAGPHRVRLPGPDAQGGHQGHRSTGTRRTPTTAGTRSSGPGPRGSVWCRPARVRTSRRFARS